MDETRERDHSRSPARGGSNGDSGGHGDSNGSGHIEGNLFIGNLSFDTTERDLEEAFSKFGRVSKARVITDRETGKPRGFGFISFEDPRDADDALTGMHGVSLQGREIRVDKTEPRAKREAAGTRGGFDNREKPLCRLYQKGDCKYGATCRFAHEGGGGGGGSSRDDRYSDRERDRDWGRSGRDSDRDSRRDSRRDDYDRRDSRRDSRRDDSRDRRDSRKDDRSRDSRRDDDRRDSRRDDERRDSRRERDGDDRSLPIEISH